MASVVETGTFPQGAPLPASSNPASFPAVQERTTAPPIDTASVSAQNLAASFAAPSTPQHRKMSYGLGGFGMPNGMGPSDAPNGFTSVNGLAQQQSSYGDNQTPPIYTAVYSGVSVYEMVINGIAVMRRRSDSWLNATQILKVANVDKGKRTKILEKEILSGEHEKVQGGYGRYQGTWINYKRGRDFCRAYGVEELLKPLLEYDMGQDGAQPGKGTMETPTKEQAMAAQRKKSMYNADMRGGNQTPNGTFFRNISSVAANAVSAITKARLDSPGSRAGSGRPSQLNKSSQPTASQESQYFPNSQQSVQSIQSEPLSARSGQIDPTLGTQNQASFYGSHKRSYSNLDEAPPKKRLRPSSSMDVTQQANGDPSRSMRDSTPTEPNESFMYPASAAARSERFNTGLPPLPAPETVEEQEKQHLLASMFLEPRVDEPPSSPDLDGLSGEDLDLPIDNQGHTALHWAASLARLSILKYLIQRGANIFRVNSGGETALMRAAMTTNNLDQGSFLKILELLGPTMELRDNRGRTVLHQIAISSGVKGRGAACRYYLDSILEFVVIQGSNNSSQQNSFAADVDRSYKQKTIGLAHFISEIVNAQDIAGDTALNLAARIDSKSIIHQLLEIGANPSVPNFGGLRPTDFGIGSEVPAKEAENGEANGLPSSQRTVTEQNGSDSSKEVLDPIAAMLKDTSTSFGADIRAKQSIIDQTQALLQEELAARAAEREQVAALEAESAQRGTAKRLRGNLRWAINEARTFLASAGVAPDADPAAADPAHLDPAAVPESDPPPANDGGPAAETAGAVAAGAAADGHAANDDPRWAQLPPAALLELRLEALRAQNAALEQRAAAMERSTAGFEARVRRIVALGTRNADAGPSGVGARAHLERLMAAVASEEGSATDLGRVRDFLRRMASEE